MKNIICLLTLLLVWSTSSQARHVGMLTCLLDGKNVHLNIHNRLKVVEGYVFDIAAAQFANFSQEQVVRNDSRFIIVSAQIGEETKKSIVVRHDLLAVQPKRSAVTIDGVEEKCQCYFGQYELDDIYFNN